MMLRGYKRLFAPNLVRLMSSKTDVVEAREYLKDRKHGKDLSKFPDTLEPPTITRKIMETVGHTPEEWKNEEYDEILTMKAGSEERTSFFKNLSEPKKGEHSEITNTKKKIRKLLDQELEFLGFKNQLKEEEALVLVDETLREVDEKKTFFYRYDDNKVNTNKRIHDINAPGNKYKKPSVIIPHEHVHPQHYIDVKTMTDDDIQEIYGLYSYYIDLHISQVRRNIHDRAYVPHQFNTLAYLESGINEKSIDNRFFEYYHRWREPERTWRSQTQEIDHEAELAAMPINPHPHPRATDNRDVEWTEDQKFPHVANRKGYPIMGQDPFETILGLERAPAHPSYQFQAFVQTPSMDPDPTLNFEKAETIYENLRVGEWVRMWRWIGAFTLPWWPAFYTFEIYQGDGAPSLQWLQEMTAIAPIPLQCQDAGDWNLEQARYCDDHDYMSIQYAIKRSIARPSHTFYIIVTLGFLHHLSLDYVTKMIYNKDKDLVFVYKPDGLWRDHEYVYEMHHLESAVPGPVTALTDIGVGKKDGITTLTCMDTNQSLRLYNDPKYWNLELRDEFLAQTRSLWIDL